jgi:hypothetical protein
MVDDKIDKIGKLVRSNFIVYVVCILTIGACVWTLGTAQQFENQCNAFWDKQVRDRSCQNCMYGYEQFHNVSAIMPINITGLGDFK